MRLKYVQTEDVEVYPCDEIFKPEIEVSYIIAYGEDYYDYDGCLVGDYDQAVRFCSLEEARTNAKELIKDGKPVSHIIKETLKRSRHEEFFSV